MDFGMSVAKRAARQPGPMTGYGLKETKETQETAGGTTQRVVKVSARNPFLASASASASHRPQP